MKKRLFYCLFVPVSLLAAGCSESGSTGEQDSGYGTLQIACTPDGNLAVRAATPQLSDFSLELSDGTTVRQWASVAEFNAESPLLLQGNYTASVSYGDPQAEGYDLPCYTGSKQFELKARQKNRVEITATIANAQALVRTTEQFRSYFHDATFVVATGAGNRFEYRFASTAGTAESDSAEPVYVRAASSLTVTGSAQRQAGDEVVFASQEIALTAPATRYIFEYGAEDAGSAVVSIYVNDKLTATIPVTVELNEDAL